MNTNPKPISAFNNTSGFTLIELVVVVLLVGIISFVAAPRFFNSSAITERSAADEVLSAIRLTQQMAMSRGGGIRFRTATDYYIIERVDGSVLESPDRIGTYQKYFPAGVTANVVAIAFTGLGEPSPNTDTVVTIGTTNITVEADTGYAHY